MARIVQFDEIANGIDKVHGPVTCGYKIFPGPTSTILQLDTYGSSERQATGKQSQSIQIDAEAAERLIELLDRAFPALRR